MSIKLALWLNFLILGLGATLYGIHYFRHQNLSQAYTSVGLVPQSSQPMGHSPLRQQTPKVLKLKKE